MTQLSKNLSSQVVSSAPVTVTQANATHDPEFLQKIALVETSLGDVSTKWREVRAKRNRLRMTGEAPPSCVIPLTAVEDDAPAERNRL